MHKKKKSGRTWTRTRLTLVFIVQTKALFHASISNPRFPNGDRHRYEKSMLATTAYILGLFLTQILGLQVIKVCILKLGFDYESQMECGFLV